MSFRQTLHRVFSLDLRALGAFRVGLGLLLLMDGVYRGLDLEAFYTDHGIAPRDSALRSLGGGWSPLAETGDLWPAWLCLSVLLGGSLLLISGRLWRVGVVACWLSLQAFNIRNGLVLQVADAIHVLLLGWAFVLPLGERFVVGRRSSGANQVLSVATAGFFAQVIWIYMAAGIYKAAEPHWTQGALLIEAAFIDPVATSWLEFLLNAPLVLEIATRITPWMEIFGPLALLIPFRLARIRLLLVATFVGFHLFGIGLMLRLALVPLTLALCWIPFLPSALWDRIWEEGGGGVPARSTLSPAVSALVVMVAGASFVPSVEHLVGERAAVPSVVRTFWRQTGFAQRRFSLWTKPAGNRHFMVAARLRDGRAVELHHRVPLDYEDPPPSPRNNHWYKAFQQLRPHQAVRHDVAAWLVWSWERDHTPAEYVEYVEVIIRQTPWMPPEWWTSGKWREGLPEPTEHRTLFRVVGHGDAFGLLKASGEADW